MSPRLLWVHQNFVTTKQPGNSRPSYIVAALLAAGLSVDVVTGTAGYLDDEGRLPAGVDRDGRLSIHRLAVLAGRSFVDHRALAYAAFVARASVTVARLMRRQRFDVVYASSPPLPQMLLAVAVATMTGTPLVVEVRDLWPACLVEEGMLSSQLLQRSFEWLESFSYRRATQVIAVAPGFAEYLERMGVERARLRVIPTGGDPRLAQLSSESARSWRDRQGLADRFIVLYTGSLNEAYDIETVISTAEQLAVRRPDIAFVIAGNGRSRSRVVDAAARTPSIHYLGAIGKDELLPVLAAGDVGLVSLRDSRLFRMVCPGKLFDYLACGKPVLSTIDGQSGAILRAAQAGLVVAPSSPEALAAAVERMADLAPTDRRAMGLRGQRWVLDNVNASTMGRRAAQTVLESLGPLPVARSLAAAASDAVLALVDVARQRAARTIDEIFERPGAIEDSFQQWLAQSSAADDGHPLPSQLADAIATDLRTHL